MPGIGLPKGGSGRAATSANSQRIRTTKTGVQTFTTPVTASVTWEAETYKDGITHSTAVSSENFTVVTAGRYLIDCLLSVVYDNAAVVISDIHLSVNRQGAGFVVESHARYATLSALELPHSMHDVLDLLAGDIVRIQYQFDGTADAKVQFTNGASTFEMHRLS
jgi:hypothetical protein